ncbi:MAG: hypothetical protein LBD40_01355, partial [Puniceicoccales bacterium]|nr:hypothetical protein [Puniceicoccales bacterium]
MGNELSVTKHVEQPAAPVATDSIRKPNEKWDTKYEPIGSSDVTHFRNLVEGKSGKGKFQNEIKTTVSSKWDSNANRLSTDTLKDQTKAASVKDFSVFNEGELVENEILPDDLWPNEGL